MHVWKSLNALEHRDTAFTWILLSIISSYEHSSNGQKVQEKWIPKTTTKTAKKKKKKKKKKKDEEEQQKQQQKSGPSPYILGEIHLHMFVTGRS